MGIVLNRVSLSLPRAVQGRTREKSTIFPMIGDSLPRKQNLEGTKIRGSYNVTIRETDRKEYCLITIALENPRPDIALSLGRNPARLGLIVSYSGEVTVLKDKKGTPEKKKLWHPEVLEDLRKSMGVVNDAQLANELLQGVLATLDRTSDRTETVGLIRGYTKSIIRR